MSGGPVASAPAGRSLEGDAREGVKVAQSRSGPSAPPQSPSEAPLPVPPSLSVFIPTRRLGAYCPLPTPHTASQLLSALFFPRMQVSPRVTYTRMSPRQVSTIRSHPGVCTCRLSLPFLFISSTCYHFPQEEAMFSVPTMSPRPLCCARNAVEWLAVRAG